jgi:pantetheine-phosphate adenylyltransferase
MRDNTSCPNPVKPFRISLTDGAKPMTIAIFPGTFDPITFGHLDLIRRAAKMFDKVIVAVADNQNKHCLFSLDERARLAHDTTRDIPHVEVTHFSGLLVNQAKEVHATVIVRGLRAVQDFEYELQIAKMNNHLAPGIETVYLTPPSHLSFVASSIVREVASLGGDVSALVHPLVLAALQKAYKR